MNTAAAVASAGLTPGRLVARYWLDALWRTTAAADTLRERAANMSAHEAEGMPPLLHFESEPVADGRDLDPPSNYRLLRVTRCGTDALEKHVRKGAAPVIVVDPRAGHGPGIGGFKRDSEVGMALLEGHPVYFVVFDPEPVEGQTMGAVVQTLAAFIDIVPSAISGKAPIVYGNCQGGWAITLALSHCEHRAALAVLNGSPLSYWAGERGINPMRLLGGFTGGVWPAHWMSDLGNGRFDGAWLVQNFEALRPEGVFRKYDTLFAQPEAEHDRFLEFERWWNGFYQLAREEMLAIAGELFVGNRLEDGEVVVDGHCRRPQTHRGAAGDLQLLRRRHHAAAPGAGLAQGSVCDDRGPGGCRPARRLPAAQAGGPPRHLRVGGCGAARAPRHPAPRRNDQDLAPGLYEMVLDDAATDGAATGARFEPRRLEDLPFDANPGWVRPGPGAVRGRRACLRAMGLAVGPHDGHAGIGTPAARTAPDAGQPADLVREGDAGPGLAAVDAAVARPVGRARSADHANPWYRLERVGADVCAQAWESWRTSRDLWAEVVFQQLYAR